MQKIVYRLRAENGVDAEFTVDTNPPATARPDAPNNTSDASQSGHSLESLPVWTRLEHHQCPDCPLDPHQVPFCPMAAALADLLAFARSLVSHSTLEVSIVTPTREIRATATAQRALSSLMGLVMATCACPDVAWLRPMARFHLPLANEEETIYRAVSMYLLAQYFRAKHGNTPDFSLSGLSARYRRMHVINIAIAKRMHDAIEQDASVNAVILLDMFAKAMPYSVDESLTELEYIFHSYLDAIDGVDNLACQDV